MNSVRRLLVSHLAALASVVAVVAGCTSPPQAPAPPPRQTPPMGWNSWNSGIALTEQNIRSTIDAMVSSGLRDAGYRYVNLDAGWAASTRDGNGNLRADPGRFPGGIAALARYAHDRGMYLGLYSSPFNEVCGQDPRVGSAGHESADADTFARWGVDYLKYDWCRTAAEHGDQVARFTTMRDALRASGRRIIYSINPNSSGDPGAGARYDWSDIADLSRNTIDLVPAWGDSTLWGLGLAGVSQEFAAAAPLAMRSRPGRWNDPDMLVVGIPWGSFVTGHPTMALPPAADLTVNEQRSHFSLWAMLAAPLLVGNDVTSMTEQTRALLTNREVIDVDQDPLVVQGTALPSERRVIVKRLADGSVAVALINTGDTRGAVATDTAAVGLPAADCYTVRDLWAHTSTTTARTVQAAAIPPHGVAMLKVTPGCR